MSEMGAEGAMVRSRLPQHEKPREIPSGTGNPGSDRPASGRDSAQVSITVRPSCPGMAQMALATESDSRNRSLPQHGKPREIPSKCPIPADLERESSFRRLARYWSTDLGWLGRERDPAAGSGPTDPGTFPSTDSDRPTQAPFRPTQINTQFLIKMVRDLPRR